MNIEKSLEEFGLTEKEAKTYLASLELGPSTIQSIAKESGIERVNTYYIIEKLIKDGLVSKTIKNNKSLFVAERPQILTEIMERRTKKLKDLLPNLKAIAKEEKKPSIKFFEGEEGIKSIYEDSLTSKTDILAWNNTANLEVYIADYFHDYYERRATKGIHIRAIVNDMPTAHEYKKSDKKLLREIRIVPKEMMDIVPECYVYENKVAFMSLRERIGVLIESKDIAEAQRKIFELAWIGTKAF